MGEYVKIDGEKVKIGTCTDLTEDISYPMLKKLVVEGRIEACEYNDTIEGYLNPEHHYIYRFPFPEEKEWGDRMEQPKIMDVPKSIMLGLNHDTYQTYLGIPGTEYRGRTVTIPCPQSEQTNYVPCNRSSYDEIIIKGETFINGELITLFECAYCGKMFYCSEDEIEIIRNELIESLGLECTADSEFKTEWMNLINRFKGSKEQIVEDEEIEDEEYLVTYLNNGEIMKELLSSSEILELLEKKREGYISKVKIYRVNEKITEMVLQDIGHDMKDPLKVKVLDRSGKTLFSGHLDIY